MMFCMKRERDVPNIAKEYNMLITSIQRVPEYLGSIRTEHKNNIGQRRGFIRAKEYQYSLKTTSSHNRQRIAILRE